MNACIFCGLTLPGGGNVLGVCPHGNAHTFCCLNDLEGKRMAEKVGEWKQRL